MTNPFVDAKAVERLSIGEDWIDLRTQLSGTEWIVIAQGDTTRSLGIIVSAWSYDAPVDAEHLAALDLPTFQIIDRWIAEHLEFPTLPNASAAPSRATTGAKPSRTPTARKGGSSTMSFSPGADGATTTSGSLPLSS